MAEDTREKILRATRTLIDNEGLEAVTLRAVGAEGGLSRGAAYRHFANKDELLSTIALENLTMLMSGFNELVESEKPPAEQLFEMMLQFYSFGVANKVHYQLMFATHWDGEKYPLLQAKGREAFELINRMLENLLSGNSIATNGSASRSAILFAFIHGLVELHLAGHTEKVKGLDNATQLIEDFIQLISA